MRLVRTAGFFIAAAGVLAACAGTSPVDLARRPPQAAATCGPPPPVPTPFPAWLAYPPTGSTNLAVTVGELIEVGATSGTPGQGLAVAVSAGGANVPIGTPAPAPSPFPSPLATLPPSSPWNPLGYAYMAVPLPTLSPSTTYTVSDVYAGWANTPPQCTANYSEYMGSFTTGS